MAQKYRMVRMSESGNPIQNQDNEQSDNRSSQQQNSDQSARRRAHPVLWVLLGIVIAAVLVGVAIWMSGVSSSLAGIHHTANANHHALAKQSSQLSGMQASLHAISRQLAQLQTSMQNFFGTLLSHFSAP